MMCHVYYKRQEIEYTKQRQALDPFEDIMAIKEESMQDSINRRGTIFNIGDFAP